MSEPFEQAIVPKIDLSPALPERPTGELGAVQPPSQEQANPSLDMQNIVAGFNRLEGDELELAVSSHLQSVIDKTITDGGDSQDVEQGLRTEGFKFVSTGVGTEGEDRVQPTFLGKLDYWAKAANVLGVNKDRIEQTETKIATEATKVKRELFSYQDVLESDQDKQEALDYTEHNQSANKYARALAKEIIKSGPHDTQEARLRIRAEFDKAIDELPESIRGEVSHFASSDSWIYWDIGKQRYLTDHPPTTEEEYADRAVYAGMGIEQDPLAKESGAFTEVAKLVQRSIASRHLGWELHQMAARGVDMSWLTQFSEQAGNMLQTSTKEDGQLHSWQYTELGREAQIILNAKLVGSH